MKAAQRITHLRTISAFCTSVLIFFLNNQNVYAEKHDPPPYPNGEQFYFSSNPVDSYDLEEKVYIHPCSFFPLELCPDKELEKQPGIISFKGRMILDLVELSFNFSGFTGPDGEVKGDFSFKSQKNIVWEYEGNYANYVLSGNGTVKEGKAAFDHYGTLQLAGTDSYINNPKTSGTITLTFTYEQFTKYSQELKQGSLSTTLEISEIACVSNFDTLNTCHIKVFDPLEPSEWTALELNFDNFSYFEQKSATTGEPAAFYELIGDVKYTPEVRLTPEQDQATKLIWDESYLDEPLKADDLKDNPKSGFTLAVFCNDDLLPGESINCRSVLTEGDLSNPYKINWVLNGFVLKTSLQAAGTDTFIFPNPPPGTHTVTVQAVNQNNNETRVTSTLVNVQVGEDPDKIKPWVQTAAGAGSVAILGAWLWAEWLAAKSQSDWQSKADEAAEEVLTKDRQQWYEEIMDLNKQEYKARTEFEKDFEDYQKSCEKEWTRFRNSLLKVTDEFHKSDYLVDLYDDMHSDVYREGVWDGKALQRLEDLVNTHLRMDRHLEASELLRDRLKSLERSQKSYDAITNNWTMCGLQMVAGVLTGGASEVVMMPARAVGNALYASRRAEILGLTGWEAAKAVMVESGWKLGKEYIWAKGTEMLVQRYGKQTAEYGAKKLVKIFGKDRVDAAAKWWGNHLAPKPNSELPVIHQKWGQGPQVFVHKPIFKQGPMPQVDLGMENYLTNRIRPLSSELADDLGSMFREGVDVKPNLNNLLSRGGRYTISAADEAAIRIMSNPAYKPAVRHGLIPASAQQAVYQARDKVCKNAVLETLERMDNMLINGKPASNFVKSVAITGTGAKPLSPQGLGHFTDFDGTVNAGESAAEREAERLFSRYFQKAVEGSGVNTRVAEVNMFSGIRPSPGGYSSAPLLHWHRVDMINRGRLAVRTNQGIMFDAHPDVAPLPNFSPLGQQPHFPVQPAMARTDAGRMVVDYINQRVRETGQILSKADILRAEGKHAIRAWKAINAGSGQRTPAFIQKLNALKNDRSLVLKQKETETLWNSFTEYLNLPKDLGG